ncbi:MULTISPECIES: DUF4159 domain-containing protein [Rhizobium]|uniref:DUF4159 domain-containing protein n=1 Tax=Rhizobium rhododendri TaxID=2506430 RepID=A0ABY8ICV7_9HYPH|nr:MULTISPECIES: DUF4159 domain-containing protein [Rhizobium]MBZ5758707.1 DUF4159 domain-containing protein [Rhizobium sp. VS19-DR96]MBZ5764463.1 DUF4159 domain-containing protein [Rhizobium sp. VS19-DR129.2]MBZ5772006.1 DUF4159 domain-containing protein [Rhizobium sp. VS19-DRK62.2]MBZ5783307.1 DUF4159 domain-containing protein [Rhizobium sp. VS19-DR121]MBZ5800755.1 DUF4159 domain-containing protein [Rhizobium sp. VS19-DR181]
MSALGFAYPAMLAALIALPAIWWLLRMTPPRPQIEVFPPLKILAKVLRREETPANSPWWLTLLRMLMAAAVILAIADPVFNPRTNTLSKAGPLVLLIDNSWASAADWDRRVQTADALIGDADASETPVVIAFTANQTNDAIPGTAMAARDKLHAAAPMPLVPDRPRAVQALKSALGGAKPGTLVFLSDGIAASDRDDTVQQLASLAPADLRLLEGDASEAIVLTKAANAADAMTVTASRLDSAGPAGFTLSAQDAQGRPIAAGKLAFTAGQSVASGTITAPFEMRNDFARVSIDGHTTAGSVHLLDDGFKRRRVALLSGQAVDEFQPLLSPLYYIQKALSPFADLVNPEADDLAKSITELLAGNPSVIIMADIGRLPADAYAPMQRWIANGGTLIRFAGPRLAAAPADDPLVPVILRQGERALGGAMSWAEPQPLADFPAFGPFAGMPKPSNVLVKRQVLAEPTPDLAERTWASLADGTPLVTEKNVSAGRIVLFHVSAEASWSDLPISGDFVEMLRRIVQMSRSGGVTAADGSAKSSAGTLPPYRLLTAKGALNGETGSARPLDTGKKGPLLASFDNPPGLYGSEEGFTALNVLPEGAELKPLDASASMVVQREGLIGGQAWSAKPVLFTIALLLLLTDSVAVLFMNGAFSGIRRLSRSAAKTAAILAIALSTAAFLHPVDMRADDARPGDDVILSRLDKTHLAYIVTGEDEVDRISERGLAGLTDFLTYRTTLEPGPPVGVDPAKDELALFPLLYWPVTSTAPMPSTATMNRIDAYMRSGGTVLFDTRDALSSVGDNSAPGPNGERLQAILANLDIPPLEPVPAKHVLTKSFYLLSSFPGRYTGSPLWIESHQDNRADTGTKQAATSDGVTPIIITGNDFAGAWAVDDNGTPLLPTVPQDDMQREYAFRTGVNIMMYMLTGNYKSDQVHVPDLLERLGQ